MRYAHYIKRVHDIDIVITDNGGDNLGQFLATIIWVNGYLTKCPKFTLITVEKLHQIMSTKTQEPFEVWGGKMCYLLDSNDYEWFDLDELDSKIENKKEEIA